MRAYTIKRTGATIWQNMVFEKSIEFSNEKLVYAGYLFFRKKDAKEYLKTFTYPEYFEVVGMTIDKSVKDNRRTSQ